MEEMVALLQLYLSPQSLMIQLNRIKQVVQIPLQLRMRLLKQIMQIKLQHNKIKLLQPLTRHSKLKTKLLSLNNKTKHRMNLTRTLQQIHLFKTALHRPRLWNLTMRQQNLLQPLMLQFNLTTPNLLQMNKHPQTRAPQTTAPPLPQTLLLIMKHKVKIPPHNSQHCLKTPRHATHHASHNAVHFCQHQQLMDRH